MTQLLVVPTRNRPKKVEALLTYLARFYPETRVVIADGSDPLEQEQVAWVCSEAALVASVVFRAYPADLPLFERLLDLVMSLDDPMLILGADDDYPLMDNYAQAAKVLSQNPNLALVVPYDVLLTHTAEGKLKARLSQSRTVAAPTAAARLEGFSRWPFATSYGAARRDTMMARYRSLSQGLCAGFVDFQVGANDCLSGQIGAMAALGSLRTHSFRGSYLRPSDRLVFLRRSADVLSLSDRLTDRLVQVDDIAPDAARETIRTALSRQIAALSGADTMTRVGFTSQRIFRDKQVQTQYSQFYDLFRDDTQMRKQYEEKLKYIVKLLLSSETVDAGEGRGNYETF